MYKLREFVLTHVILTPGARGREGPGGSSLHHFRWISWIRWIRWISFRVPN